MIVDDETLSRFLNTDDKAILKKGIFQVQKRALNNYHLIKILPSSILTIYGPNHEGISGIVNPDYAEDFLICPNCQVHWLKKSPSIPRKCPHCQMPLHEFNIDDLGLDHYIKKMGCEVRIIEEENYLWKYHFKTRENRIERIRELIIDLHESAGYKISDDQELPIGDSGGHVD